MSDVVMSLSLRFLGVRILIPLDGDFDLCDVDSCDQHISFWGFFSGGESISTLPRLKVCTQGGTTLIV